MTVHIDQKLCRACGSCGTVCPSHITEIVGSNGFRMARVSPEREGLCIICGHCTAVCPTGAITVDGLPQELFEPTRKVDISADELLALLRQRRSIRRYRRKPVPREIISRIADAAGASPTGSGSQSIGVIVIDNPETLAALSDLVHAEYEGLEKGLANPVVRFLIERKVKKTKGNHMFGTLQNFVMPSMRWYLRWHREGKGDEVLRDCTALMLFHSPAVEPMASSNCTLAAFHAILLAETIGLGTCFNDLVPQACSQTALRAFLELPDDHDVYAGLTMGYPKYRYRRVVPRKPAAVRYFDWPAKEETLVKLPRL